MFHRLEYLEIPQAFQPPIKDNCHRKDRTIQMAQNRVDINSFGNLLPHMYLLYNWLEDFRVRTAIDEAVKEA
ncbi:hypothetical protein TWF281_003426 [Arthrobotrys megalospora]